VLYYILGDQLGSTVLVTYQGGAEVGRVAYDPWGQVQVWESTLPPGITDRLFTGQRWDEALSLYECAASP
jgi:hypothetical protein